MKNFSKGKPQKIRKAHYLTSLTAFIVTFGALGLILQFSSYATTTIGTVVGIDGKCLDNDNNLAKSGNKIQLWTCLGDESQAWTVNGTVSTPGTIVNENGYCLDISGGKTTIGTPVVLYTCDGNTSQEWVYNAETGVIINKASNTCLDDYQQGTDNGNEIDIYTCNGGTNQKWNYKVPTAVSTPTPAPTPVSTPAPVKKTTSPTTTSPPISVTNTFSPPTSAPALNQTTSTSQTPAATTKLNQTGTATSPVPSPPTTPVISDVAVSNVTPTSAQVAWDSNVGANYTVKYGENPSSLSSTDHFNASGTNVQIKLNKLPAGKHIYLSITPTYGSSTGSMKNVDFKTPQNQKTNLWVPILIALVFLLAIIGMLIKLIGRKPVVPDHSSDELPLPETPPVIPREDQATYNNRVNWWMPPKYRQMGTPRNTSTDQYPDMFTEGRKRLEEEEKEHKLPKE